MFSTFRHCFKQSPFVIFVRDQANAALRPHFVIRINYSSSKILYYILVNLCLKPYFQTFFCVCVFVIVVVVAVMMVLVVVVMIVLVVVVDGSGS